MSKEQKSAYDYDNAPRLQQISEWKAPLGLENDIFNTVLSKDVENAHEEAVIPVDPRLVQWGSHPTNPTEDAWEASADFSHDDNLINAGQIASRMLGVDLYDN